MLTSITKRIVTKALTRTVAASWLIGVTGQRGAERLLMAERCPSSLERLYAALQATERALGDLVVVACAHLGIEMDDVLAPLIAARIGA